MKHQRVAGLVSTGDRGLLDDARERPVVLAPVALSQVVARVEELLRTQARRQGTRIVVLASAVTARGDFDQLDQGVLSCWATIASPTRTCAKSWRSCPPTCATGGRCLCFFTHALVTGLRTGADVNGDALVTLNEASQFAYTETLARTEVTARGPQHPASDIQPTGTGDLVMTDLRSTTAGLILADDVGGRFFVRDSVNNLVAEHFKPQGRSVDLGLPPGEYRVTLEQDGQLFRTDLSLRDGGRTTLGPQDLLPLDREQTVARGGPRGRRRAGARAHHGGLWPSWDSKKELRNLEINLIATRATDLAGVALSMGATIVVRDSAGLQASMGFNVAGGVRGGALPALRARCRRSPARCRARAPGSPRARARARRRARAGRPAPRPGSA